MPPVHAAGFAALAPPPEPSFGDEYVVELIGGSLSGPIAVFQPKRG